MAPGRLDPVGAWAANLDGGAGGLARCQSCCIPCCDGFYGVYLIIAAVCIHRRPFRASIAERRVDRIDRPDEPAAAATITVYAGGWHRTFGPGGDVVIGRDVQADVRLPQPAVSRAHVLLRYLDGHRIAVDNASTNGMFVEQQRVSSVDIRDGQTIHIGEPDGPPVTFELGRDGTLTATIGPRPRRDATADGETERVQPRHRP